MGYLFSNVIQTVIGRSSYPFQVCQKVLESILLSYSFPSQIFKFFSRCGSHLGTVHFGFAVPSEVCFLFETVIQAKYSIAGVVSHKNLVQTLAIHLVPTLLTSSLKSSGFV